MKKWIMMMFIIMACGYSLNIEDYLCAGEDTTLLTEDMIGYSGQTYNVVFYDSAPIFIYSNDVVLQDENQIGNIIKYYYTQEYFPDGVNLTGLRGFIESYDESRNADYDYKNINSFGGSSLTIHEPETSCARALGLTNGRYIDYNACNDSDSCTRLARSLWMRFEGKKFELDEVPYVGQITLQFRTNANAINTSVFACYDAIDNSNLENLYDSLVNIQDYLDVIETNTEEIFESNTVLPDDPSHPYTQCRTDYEYIAEHGKCMGFCSEMPHDLSYVDDAKEEVEELLGQAEPLKNIETLKSQLSNSSISRMDYYSKKGMITQILVSFNSVEGKHNYSLTEAEDALLLVEHSELEQFYNDVSDLRDKISNDIYTVNVSDNTDNEIDQLGKKYLDLEELLDTNVTKDYNDINALRKDIASQFISIKILNPTSETHVNRYNELGAGYTELEDQYSPPMTPEGYTEYKEKYMNLSYEINVLYNEILGAQSGTVVQAANGVKQSATQGVFTLASGFMAVDSATKANLEPIIPISLLAITNVSLVALVTVIFIGLVYSNKMYIRKKRVVLTWAFSFLVIVGLIGAVSIGGWYLMTQGGSTVEMGPTIGQIKASNETAIIVNTIGASTDSISSMKKCAKELMKTDALKDSHYYILEPDSCRINGETKTPEECELEINSMAHITMIYNRDEIRKGHFFNSGKYEMTISGEADIFDDCEAYYLFDN